MLLQAACIETVEISCENNPTVGKCSFCQSQTFEETVIQDMGIGFCGTGPTGVVNKAKYYTRKPARDSWWIKLKPYYFVIVAAL